jgi:hypothetical protein
VRGAEPTRFQTHTWHPAGSPVVAKSRGPGFDEEPELGTPRPDGDHEVSPRCSSGKTRHSSDPRTITCRRVEAAAARTAASTCGQAPEWSGQVATGTRSVESRKEDHGQCLNLCSISMHSSTNALHRLGVLDAPDARSSFRAACRNPCGAVPLTSRPSADLTSSESSIFSAHWSPSLIQYPEWLSNAVATMNSTGSSETKSVDSWSIVSRSTRVRRTSSNETSSKGRRNTQGDPGRNSVAEDGPGTTHRPSDDRPSSNRAVSNFATGSHFSCSAGASWRAFTLHARPGRLSSCRIFSEGSVSIIDPTDCVKCLHHEPS